MRNLWMLNRLLDEQTVHQLYSVDAGEISAQPAIWYASKTKIEQYLQRGFLFIIFDIKKAYDKTWRYGILIG